MDMPMECLICDLKLPNYAALENHLSEHIITSATEIDDSVDNNNEEIHMSHSNTENVSMVEIEKDKKSTPSETMVNHNASDKLLLATLSDIGCLSRSCNYTNEDCTISPSTLDLPMTNSSRVSKPPINGMVPSNNNLLTDECINDALTKLLRVNTTTNNSRVQISILHIDDIIPSNNECNSDALNKLPLATSTSTDMGRLTKSTLDDLMVPMMKSSCDQISIPPIYEIVPPKNQFLTNKYHTNRSSLHNSDYTDRCLKLLAGMDLDSSCFVNMGGKFTLEQLELTAEIRKEDEKEQSTRRLTFPQLKEKEVPKYDSERSNEFEDSYCNKIAQSKYYDCQQERKTSKFEKLKREISMSEPEKLDKMELCCSAEEVSGSSSDSGRDSDSSVTNNDEYYPNKKSEVKKKAKKLKKGTSIHVCQQCDKHFAKSSALEKHYRKHTGEKPYQCLVCSKKFSQSWNLKAHLRTHDTQNTGKQRNAAIEKKVCHQCNKGFCTDQDLKRHQSVHTGEKPYGCLFCKKRFAQNGNLTVHLQTHMAQVKPFSCDQCDVKYTRRSVLVAHTKFVHCKELNFQCKKCHKFFAHNSTLKKHMLTHTSRPLIYCKDCPKTFTTKSNLNRHRKCHKKLKSGDS